MKESPSATPLELPHAWPYPRPQGVLRFQPVDFQVEERLGFEPSGEGEHAFLWIEKTDLNTADVAVRLAKLAGVAKHQVGFSGLKDRHAVTRQWFSVHLPGRSHPDWQSMDSEQLSVLQVTRHKKKLRRGVHRDNHFVIRVRELQGDLQALGEVVGRIGAEGVPNYFGEQRFGLGGDNVNKARAWFRGQLRPGRNQRGFYLSAVRSQLFNQVLAHRVQAGNWNTALPGELCMLAGSHSLVSADAIDAQALATRLREGDLHPTGPLWGRPGKLAPGADALALEQGLLTDTELLRGLEQQGVESARRALRVIPQALAWQVEPADGEPSLRVEFSLPSGCFATAVMRELLGYRIASTGEARTDGF